MACRNLGGLGADTHSHVPQHGLVKGLVQSVGAIAARLVLESSTPKRLEAAGLLRRTRNPANERQVLIALTDKGRDIREGAGCLGNALSVASGQSAPDLARLNREIAVLRNAIYGQIGTWDPAPQDNP